MKNYKKLSIKNSCNFAFFSLHTLNLYKKFSFFVLNISFALLLVSCSGVGGSSSSSNNNTDNILPSLSINDASIEEGVNNQVLIFTITASSVFTSDITFNYATSINSGANLNEQAQPTSDFIAVNSTATIKEGNTTVNIEVTIVGNDISESTESFLVVLSNPTNAILGDSTAIGTILDKQVFVSSCKNPTLISTIQGANAKSSMEDSTVTLSAIVVGSFQESTSLEGFFVQESEAEEDGNPLTSEGIFVYHGSNTVPEVAVGDAVCITGAVKEYNDDDGIDDFLTEIVAPSSSVDLSIIIEANSQPVPAATVVTLPVASIETWERYEGMRVVISATENESLTVTGHYNLAKYGIVLLSAGGELRQFTEDNTPNDNQYSNHLLNIMKRSILLDDGDNTQNRDPILFGRECNSLSANNTLRIGDTIPNITGFLHQNTDISAAALSPYRIHKNTCSAFVINNNRPNSVPVPNSPHNLSIASLNLLNYFTTLKERGADTAEEFTRQQAKIVSAIRGLNADIVGLMELENNYDVPESAATSLVTAVNDGAATIDFYTFVNPNGKIGSGEIAVGLIYKSAKVKEIGIARIIDDSSTPPPPFNTNRNRPSLIQSFRETTNNGVITVAVNHFKSKSSACDTEGDPDKQDGQGNCSITRTNAANALATWLRTNPTGSSSTNDIIIIGDLNSYSKEDPIVALIDQGYKLLKPTAENDYGYVFNGQVGNLDHALVTLSNFDQFIEVYHWSINASEPRSLDYNTEFKSANHQANLYETTAYRSSDHDPIISYFLLDEDPIDETPPIWIKAPIIDTITTDSVTVSLETGETAILYYALYKGDYTTAITAADIQSRTDASSFGTVIASNISDVAISISELEADTNYSFYAILVDGEQNNSTIESVSFTTAAQILESNCTGEIFISEYVEGSSNNKVIELYNPQSAGCTTVDLSTYALRVYSNGASTATRTINLTGTLDPQNTYIVSHTSAADVIKNIAQQTSGSLNFNGDDAVELVKDSNPIDVVGTIGDSADFAKDETLERIGCTPNLNYTTNEWTRFLQDTFTGLESHTCN